VFLAVFVCVSCSEAVSQNGEAFQGLWTTFFLASLALEGSVPEAILSKDASGTVLHISPEKSRERLIALLNRADGTIPGSFEFETPNHSIPIGGFSVACQ
jgi:hypothetical protein